MSIIDKIADPWIEAGGRIGSAGESLGRMTRNIFGDIGGWADRNLMPSDNMARAIEKGEQRKYDLLERMYEEGKVLQSPFYETGINSLGTFINQLNAGEFFSPSGGFQYDRFNQQMPTAFGYQPTQRGGTMPVATPYTPREAFNPQADPGFQFRLQQGQKAIEGAAAAQGNQLSGGTLKDLMEYGQGLASDEAANAFNRYTWGQDFGRSLNTENNMNNWRNYAEAQRQHEWDNPFAMQAGQQGYQNQMANYGLGRDIYSQDRLFDYGNFIDTRDYNQMGRDRQAQYLWQLAGLGPQAAANMQSGGQAFGQQGGDALGNMGAARAAGYGSFMNDAFGWANIFGNLFGGR
jgi:hypothetical protein